MKILTTHPGSGISYNFGFQVAQLNLAKLIEEEGPSKRIRMAMEQRRKRRSQHSGQFGPKRS